MPYKYSYEYIHYWLIKTFGIAKECEFCNTKSAKRYEYCLKKENKHDKNKNNYLQLCTSCHRKYDYTDERKQKIRNTMIKDWQQNRKKRLLLTKRGFKLSEAHIEKIRQSKLGDKNPAKRLEVREKIRNTVKRLHREGVYKK